MKSELQLEHKQIVATITRLEERITDRFPDSGLRTVCHQFLHVAQETKDNIELISGPMLALRIFTYAVIAVGLGVLGYGLANVEFDIGDSTLVNLVTLAEAMINDIVLLGAAIFFLISLEMRIKRSRTAKYLNELRTIAHVVDMHQLTKDPMVHNHESDTVHSPSRSLNRYELQRYLDYCSEMLALIAKVAALYAQSLPDDGVVQAVNDVEQLSGSMSSKIWQKLNILNESTPRETL